MMRSTLFLAIFFWMWINASFTQSVEFEKNDSIVGKYSAFSVDNFGRISVVKNDVILNFSNKLDTLFSTSLKSVRPTTIESSKSFRTLVFDQERSVIHFLDNTLTDIHGEIDLVNLDIQQPVLVCESFGGNTFWILDAGAMRLIKLNENLEQVIITENLVSIFSGDYLPTQMMESNDYLFALIPEKGIAIFDVFGTFIRIYPCKASAFDVYKNYLILLNNNQLTATSFLPDNTPDQFFSCPADVIQFKFTAEKVYFLTPKSLVIGKYILPKEKK